MGKVKHITWFIIVVSSLLLVGPVNRLYSENNNSDEDIYYSVLRSTDIFGKIYKEVLNNYVEPVDPQRFIEAGIQGMLNELDPYTVYLQDEGKDELEIMTRGKYYGVGMRISLRNGWPTVAEQPFPNSPAARADIREGDQVIEIDGHNTKGEKLAGTAARLRGAKKGSEVRLKILRVGVPDPIELTLIRDEIVVSEVEYSGFVEPGVGLIRLTRFNRGAGKQVKDCIESLRDQGMTSLVFDLRGNPGGLLDVAVSVLENFVPKGELVVFTQGRDPEERQDFRTRRDPALGDLPLVVLVDEFSASASEIVAGALQDLDRAVIVGSETFGKGLVQTVVNLDSRGEAKLKITTAQYFIPSGRLIQRPEVFNRSRGSVLLNSNQDSVLTTHDDNPELKAELHEQYLTKNGRKVYGGGGVRPEVEIENQRTTKYVAELRRNSMFFNFSLNYVADHDDMNKDIVITDDMLNDFNKFVEEKNFDYKPDGIEELEALEKTAKDEGYFDQMKPYFDSIHQQFEQVKKSEREKSVKDIKYLLKRELAAKLYGNDASYQATFERDDVLQKAVKIIKSPDEYDQILHVNLASKN